MRIATWNINGLRARIDFVQLWLADREPDVVGFQELKMTEEQFPFEAFRESGYHSLVHGQKAWNGVAVLSKVPGELSQAGLPGEQAFGSRLITAHFDDLDFTTVYCPNGKSVSHDDYPKKLAWFDSLIDHVAATRRAGKRSVLCGDFNICPTALDSHDDGASLDHIFHTDAERDRIARLLQAGEGGLTDLFRHHKPDERAYSWWDYRAGGFPRNHGLRIDFLLGSPEAVAACTDACIDRDYRKKKDGLTASDHAPVIADLA